MKAITAPGSFGLVLPACLWTDAIAGEQPAGPTMDETKVWLELDGRGLMRANRLQADRVRLTITAGTDHVETITLENCTLFWRMVRSHHTISVTASGSRVGPTTTQTYDVILVLRDLSPGSITVEPDTLLTDPIYAVRFVIRNSLESTSTSSTDNGNPYAIRATGLPVQTAEDGQRVANAITHAAALCGVSNSGVF